MGVLDKFLEIMKLDDDDDYEDGEIFDDEYDGYDEYEEERPKKKSMFRKERRSSYVDDDYADEPEPRRSSYSGGGGKVTPMRQPAARKSSLAMEVCVIRPNKFDDTREIIETLLGSRTVILNLEGMDLEIAQRIIDFASGAAFAIDGNLQKISNFIFLVTPSNVDISGDLQDLLGGGRASFDTPPMQGRY